MVCGSIPYGDLEFFPLSHARDKTKKDLPLVLFWLRILDFISRGSVLGFDH